MELSSEDTLRLNVLLANKPLAVRIDESRMIVYGLSEQGEAKIQLNPAGRPEQYVRKVRELLSGHILGSPGGYPVYLRRWTRMGQMRDESLEQLLMLGEPEAVVAAVCSPGLTAELARRAWWAMEDAENARRMLGHRAVVESPIGQELARYLVEYLPFETETEKMTESVRLVLQPGLLDQATRLELWKKSGRKQAYLVGFLAAVPDDLPQPVAARADAEACAARLEPLAAAANPYAQLLLRVLAPSGQTFLKTLEAVLKKPPTQEVVTAAFDVARAYFRALRPEGDPDQTLPQLLEDAERLGGEAGSEALHACLAVAPELRGDMQAMRICSGLGYGVLRPLIGGSSAMGSLLRRKLEPALGAVLEQIARLRGLRKSAQ